MDTLQSNNLLTKELMKLTNKLNLPQPIVDAVSNDPYTKGSAHISITGLCSPPRIRVLRKKHEHELTEDVSDRIYTLLGQVMHGILEKANKEALSETRFYLDIEGVKVSGQLDAYYETGLVQDYKLVSLYSVKDGVKPEYEEQLNCYAQLLRANNKQVNKLELVCILRDWSKGKAQHDPTLPQQQVIKLPVKLWDEKTTLAFLRERVRLHTEANKILPECTPEERWNVPDKWAVMPKKGAAKSIKNHVSKENADLHAAQLKGSFVERRPGKNNRCDDYCPVSDFCTQYKKLREDNNG
jgi:hypothetical protein